MGKNHKSVKYQYIFIGENIEFLNYITPRAGGPKHPKPLKLRGARRTLQVAEGTWRIFLRFMMILLVVVLFETNPFVFPCPY